MLREFLQRIRVPQVWPNTDKNIFQTMSAHRRSLLLVEEALVGPRLLKDLATVDSQSDANLLRTVVNAIEPEKLPDVLEALSLEVGAGRELTWRRSVCITDLIDACIEDCREEAKQVVEEILEEVIGGVVERQVEVAAVTSYTHFYHPLANSEDITRMTDVLHSTKSSLTDGAERLQEAYRIILVQAGRQIAVSYRNILLRQTAKLQGLGEESNAVAAETVGELLDVTRRVAELTVEFLKAATRDVVDSNVERVKHILATEMRQQPQHEQPSLNSTDL